MSNDRPQNWLAEATKRAKASALPIYVEPMAQEAGVEVAVMVDAIEAALMMLTGNAINEESMRAALRTFAEPYAQSIGADWHHVADAIIGTLEWSAPDPSSWTLDAWGDAERRR